MMKFADLERAHLTLAFLKQFPSATDVHIKYISACEKITATVRLHAADQDYRYTFSTSSDDDEYIFINDTDPSDCVIAGPMPNVPHCARNRWEIL
jgi:hypothetical protein